MQSSAKRLIVALACCSAVLASADTSPPPSTAVTHPCECDCNGDGVVCGNEVTIGLHVLAGNRELDACPSFDDGWSLYGLASFLESLCLNNLVNGCPGEPQSAPYCVGDCNYDGEVVGSEVTMAINIVAGNLPLSACPNIECPPGPGPPFRGNLWINNLANGCPH